MRGLKRLAALLLALCLLAAMLSTTAFAESQQDGIAAEKAKAIAALTAPKNPNQMPLNAGSLARSRSSNYTILRNHINNSGVLADDGYVRIIDWTTADDGSEYYFSAINEPSGIKFQYLSLHPFSVDCGVLLEFVLTSTSVYVSAVADVAVYDSSQVLDEVTQTVSVNIGTYTTETLLPFNNSSNYITSGNFSDIMNGAMLMLCQYWDMYCYENLGFGLSALGFDNFSCSHFYDSDCDTVCNWCGETRTTAYSHSYTSDCDAACDNCRTIRTPVSNHAFNGSTACSHCYATFSDVSTTSWQIDHVIYVYDKGLMAGKGSNENGDVRFDPNSPITREEFVQVLYNAEGKPSVESEKLFPDVASNGWYKNAVLWAYENNIASGMGNGNFGVGKNISRQDLALMLYKYASLKGYSLDATEGMIYQFADGGSVAVYASVATDWAVTKGILSGKGNAGDPISSFHLDPAGTATRAECAAMLRNFMTKFGS